MRLASTCVAAAALLAILSCKDQAPPTPTQLSIATQPSPTVANGSALAQQPAIQLLDDKSAPVAQAGVVVAAELASGSGSLGGILSATTNSSGLATFSDLNFTGLVGDRTIRFTSGSLTNVTSGTITVLPGPATTMALTQQPSTQANSGYVLNPGPKVQLRDQSGNAAAQAGVTVTAAIISGAAAIANAVVTTGASGEAWFSQLKLTGTIGSYTFRFTAPGFAQVDAAAATTMGPGDASKLTITTQPPVAAQNGVAFSPQPVVRLQDVSSNDVSQAGVVVTAATVSGAGTFTNGTATTSASGIATFSGLALSATAGSYTLRFTAPNLTAADASAATSLTATCTSDTDNDRLTDCVETNTNVFINASNTGTNPNDSDSDDDGIKDGDEVLGSTAGLDLPGLGVNPLRKDILIEFDWFNDNNDASGSCPSHSHRPTAVAIAKLVTAMSGGAINNPNGITGINIIADYGQSSVFTGGNFISDADGVLTGGVNDTEFKNYKLANLDSKRAPYFHYTLLPHRYADSSSSSGQAELPGNDLIVSLYCFGSDQNVANTIMHELGHNLNLLHGGQDNFNWKPNYNSVMNYKYQFLGVDSDCTPAGNAVLNFSPGTRPQLDESSLDETKGICGNPPGPGVDWNGDTDALDIGISADINKDDDGFGDLLTITLRDFNDWTTMVFTGLSSADGAALLASRIASCSVIPLHARRVR